jgi:hypothetical protein
MVVFTFSHKEVRKQQKQQLLCYQPNIPQVYYFLSKRSFQSFLTRNLLLLFHLLSHRLHPSRPLVMTPRIACYGPNFTREFGFAISCALHSSNVNP